MKSGLEFLPVRGRLAAALVEWSPGVAAFYSARQALDVLRHAAMQTGVVQLAEKGESGRKAEDSDDNQFGFKHRGNSISNV